MWRKYFIIFLISLDKQIHKQTDVLFSFLKILLPVTLVKADQVNTICFRTIPFWIASPNNYNEESNPSFPLTTCRTLYSAKFCVIQEWHIDVTLVFSLRTTYIYSSCGFVSLVSGHFFHPGKWWLTRIVSQKLKGSNLWIWELLHTGESPKCLCIFFSSSLIWEFKLNKIWYLIDFGEQVLFVLWRKINPHMWVVIK